MVYLGQSAMGVFGASVAEVESGIVDDVERTELAVRRAQITISDLEVRVEEEKLNLRALSDEDEKVAKAKAEQRLKKFRESLKSSEERLVVLENEAKVCKEVSAALKTLFKAVSDKKVTLVQAMAQLAQARGTK